MYRFIEKSSPFIILLLLLIVLASLFFWPSITSWVSWAVIAVGFCLVVTRVILKQIHSYRQKEITRTGLWRNIIVEIIGILIAIALSMAIAGRIAGYAARAVAEAVEITRPGMGAIMGVLAGLFVGVVTGLAIGVLVISIWDSLTKSKRPAPGEK